MIHEFKFRSRAANCLAHLCPRSECGVDGFLGVSDFQSDCILYLTPSYGQAWGFFAMKNAAELRRQADDCRQLASIEADDDNKAYWLKKAADWEILAGKAHKRQGRQDLN